VGDSGFGALTFTEALERIVPRLHGMPVLLPSRTFGLACSAMLLGAHAGRPPGPRAPVSFCSLVPVAVGRDSATTFFVGTALPDTVRAGHGGFGRRLRAALGLGGPGHWGTPTRGAIYGQVIRVERLGGAGAAALDSAFGRSAARELIVVPWDYGASCDPVPWGRSARWVEAVTPGFYRTRLRPRSQWVDGRPVADAFAADLEPYPHGLFFREGYRGTDALRTGPSLTPAEYFALYAALPDEGQARRDPRGAAAALDAWVREHPELAETYPAPEVLRFARYRLDRR